VNATVEDVSVKERLAYDKVLGIVDRYICASHWTVWYYR
jgi:hypothetical protein